MSLEIIRKPGDISQVNNPIAFEVETMDETQIDIDLQVRDESVFKASYIPFGGKVCFDIAEILRNFVTSAPVPTVNPPAAPTMLMNDFKIPYALIVQGKEGETKSFKGEAIPGGVSKHMFKMLRAAQKTFIEFYMEKPLETQYFLTTRTIGKHLVIKETELCPLVCIHAGFQLTAHCEHGHEVYIPYTGLPGDISVIDIEWTRKNHFKVHGCLFSYLKLTSHEFHGRFADISITPGDLSGESIVLLFRNSLGCYEKIEISGKKEYAFDSEDENYRVFDEETGDYTTERSRPELQQKIRINTGVKTKEELEFMQDLICSDDIWMIRGEGQRRVLVTCEEYNYTKPVKEPTSLVLNIEMTEKESGYTPEIVIPPAFARFSSRGNVLYPEGGLNSSIGVVSNTRWGITKPEEGHWVAFERVSGQGDGFCPFNMKANTGRNRRSILLGLTIGGQSRPVDFLRMIQEKAGSRLTMDKTRPDVPGTGATVIINGTSNSPHLTIYGILYQYGVTGNFSAPGINGGATLALDGNPQTIHIPGDPGAVEEYSFKITLVFPRNPLTDKIAPYIDVTDSQGTKRRCQFLWMPKATLTLSRSFVGAPSNGSTVDVTVTSNDSWTVS